MHSGFALSARHPDWDIVIVQREQHQVLQRGEGSGEGMGHLVLSSVFCHLTVALVLGQQDGLLLHVVAGWGGLAGSQGMQAQLGQAAHEHMQLAPNPLLHLHMKAQIPTAHGSGEQ